MAKNYSNAQKGMSDEAKNATKNSTSQEKDTTQSRAKNTTTQNQQKNSAEDCNGR